MLIRPRRNRKTAAIRDLVRENDLLVREFIYPLFLTEGKNVIHPVTSMPGISRYSADKLIPEIESCLALGLHKFALFPALSEGLKDERASESVNQDGLYLSCIREIKTHYPEVMLMTDVAMDPYSSDGHDGLVVDGIIDNDQTLPILGAMALAQAQAGADMVGPSDMMDGRVKFIREILDKNGFSSVSIISYTAKYASAFYGPFRDALDSAPKNGDKKTYQMDPANAKEALREAFLDINEGADILMVKPALAYLDIIRSLSENTQLPVAAYHVSGEYAMVKAAAMNGWINEEQAMLECLMSIKRAGAKIILSYYAKEFASLGHI